MSNEKTTLELFGEQYNLFVRKCEDAEQSGVWDVEEHGDAEAWFDNDMSCLITALTAADGEFHEEEAAFLNEALSLRFTPETLRGLYEDLGEHMESFLETAIPESMEMLRSIYAELAEDYRQLMRMIGRFVIESDGITAKSEIAAAERLLAALRD